MGETAGEWLEKELIDLCKKVESLDLDREIISGLVSYCELAQPLDAKEYLDNIIGQQVGKSVTEEYLRLRGLGSRSCDVPASNFQAYVKPASNQEKSFKTQKGSSYKDEPRASGSQAKPKKNDASVNQENPGPTQKANSKKKKGGKVVSLAEAAKGAIIFQKGKPCSCQARRHKLVSNCLSCGKIVCEQEGEGPCHFCGALVLKEGSTYAGLQGSLGPVLSDAEVAAEAFAKRLVDYDRNSAARTTVIDDQSDYYEIEGNSWLSKEEKDLLKKKQEEVEEAERVQRNKVVVSFDLVGRKVMLNKDEVPQLESEKRILRPVEEREVNRIKPNPNLKLQPIFIDPGRIKKPVKTKQPTKSLPNGLCLEITGRVQHDFVTDNQQATSSNGDVECSLDYN